MNLINKKYRSSLIIALAVAVGYSCVEPDDLVTENAREGGLLKPAATSITYKIGDNSAKVGFSVLNKGPVKTTEITVYKSFYSNAEGAFTNETALPVIDVTDQSGNSSVEASFTYNELIDGLLLGGDPLPASDADLSVGDYWQFRIESLTSTGEVSAQSYVIKVVVSGRLAGVYNTIDAAYYRIGVLTYDENTWGDANGQITIESIDDNTYRMVEYWGPFNGNELFFDVDGTDISYPAETPDGDDQVGNGAPLITCADNPGDMTNVNCGNTNFVVLDDVNGEDELTMSFGYYTAGSGPREFYQVLRKVVD